MVTGASTADVAVVLVDARKGVLTQTRRHSYIAKLMGIRRFVLAVTKMDLVDFDQARSKRSPPTIAPSPRRSGSTDWTAIPLSGLNGDNVAGRGERCPGTRADAARTAGDGAGRCGRRCRQAVAHAGAVGQPAEPRFPRVRRAGRGGSGRAGRPRCGSCRRARTTRIDADRHRRRRSRRGRRRPVGDLDLRRRGRLLARRRRSRPRPTPPEVGGPVRGDHRLDGGRGADARARLLAEAGAQTVTATVQRAQVRDQRQHARASRGARRCS